MSSAKYNVEVIFLWSYSCYLLQFARNYSIPKTCSSQKLTVVDNKVFSIKLFKQTFKNHQTSVYKVFNSFVLLISTGVIGDIFVWFQSKNNDDSLTELTKTSLDNACKLCKVVNLKAPVSSFAPRKILQSWRIRKHFYGRQTKLRNFV